MLESFVTAEITPILLFLKFRGLHEESIVLLDKHGRNTAVVDVLCENVGDFERARAFAADCNDPTVWSHLAKMQLKKGFIPDAIRSYTAASDYDDYQDVMHGAVEQGKLKLINFL